MLYRKMPGNGDELSILGFGCMRLPLKADKSVDQERSVSQIRYSIDKGVNYVDTAWPYMGGQSERILGKALESGYREKVKVADKLPIWLVNSRRDMDKYLSKQLDILKVDKIDYYLIHSLYGPSWERVKKLGIADFLDSAIKDGRIVNAGFSYHGLPQDFNRVVDGYPWTFCQIQYNFLDEENQAGTAGLEYAASKGLGIIVMEALRGGNISRPTPPAEIKELWDSAKTKRTPAEWALRWVWNRPEVTMVLSGMNEESHIEENIRIAGEAKPNSLNKDELDLVKKVAVKYKDLMKVNCTGCGYCMPCPEGVRIPTCFETYNNIHVFKMGENAKFLYSLRMGSHMAGETGHASKCTECGECIEKCPQNIQIPDELKKVASQMESPEMEEKLKAFFAARGD